MVTSEFIKVGIIGMGDIGPAHYNAICSVGGVEVTSIVEVNRERAAYCAEKYGFRKVYTDYRSLLDDKEIQVVHILSPNHLHYEQAKAALEAGKHVICEKPLGVNPTQTAELVSLAKEKNLINEVNYNHRFFPLVFHAREMIRRNELGPVTQIRAYALGDLMLSFSHSHPDHWRTKPETVGLSKTMSTYGGHCLDLLQFVSGLKIEQVFADFGYADTTRKGLGYDGHDFIRDEGGQLEDHANLLLRFDKGAKGAVTFSEAAPGRKCEVFFEMVGMKASISWNLANPNEMWIGYQNKPNELFYKDADLLYPEGKEIAGPPYWQQDGFVDSLKHCIASVYQYMREEKHLQGVAPDFATFETGHNMELILQAMMNSVRKEKWEKVL